MDGGESGFCFTIYCGYCKIPNSLLIHPLPHHVVLLFIFKSCLKHFIKITKTFIAFIIREETVR